MVSLRSFEVPPAPEQHSSFIEAKDEPTFQRSLMELEGGNGLNLL